MFFGERRGRAHKLCANRDAVMSVVGPVQCPCHIVPFWSMSGRFRRVFFSPVRRCRRGVFSLCRYSLARFSPVLFFFLLARSGLMLSRIGPCRSVFIPVGPVRSGAFFVVEPVRSCSVVCRSGPVRCGPALFLLVRSGPIRCFLPLVRSGSGPVLSLFGPGSGPVRSLFRSSYPNQVGGAYP